MGNSNGRNATFRIISSPEFEKLTADIEEGLDYNAVHPCKGDLKHVKNKIECINKTVEAFKNCQTMKDVEEVCVQSLKGNMMMWMSFYSKQAELEYVDVLGNKTGTLYNEIEDGEAPGRRGLDEADRDQLIQMTRKGFITNDWQRGEIKYGSDDTGPSHIQHQYVSGYLHRKYLPKLQTSLETYKPQLQLPANVGIKYNVKGSNLGFPVIFNLSQGTRGMQIHEVIYKDGPFILLEKDFRTNPDDKRTVVATFGSDDMGKDLQPFKFLKNFLETANEKRMSEVAALRARAGLSRDEEVYKDEDKFYLIARFLNKNLLRYMRQNYVALTIVDSIPGRNIMYPIINDALTEASR